MAGFFWTYLSDIRKVPGKLPAGLVPAWEIPYSGPVKGSFYCFLVKSYESKAKMQDSNGIFRMHGYCFHD